MNKLIAIIGFLLFPSAALAADLAPKQAEPTLPLPYSWSGFYTGVQGGYTWTGSENVAGARVSPSGGFGGIYGGYNYQFDSNIVTGMEGDFNLADVKARSSILYQGQGNTLPANMAFSSRLDWMGAARLRVGYAFDRFMPYVAGGLAFEHSSISNYFAGLDYGWRKNDTRFGWTIGGGLEYAFTDNLIGRLEYRFSDYGSFSIPLPTAPLPSDTRVHQNNSDVRAGVSYKF